MRLIRRRLNGRWGGNAMNDPLGDAVRLVFGELVSPAKIEALRRELRLPDPRREVLVSAVPLQISIERGPMTARCELSSTASTRSRLRRQVGSLSDPKAMAWCWSG